MYFLLSSAHFLCVLCQWVYLLAGKIQVVAGNLHVVAEKHADQCPCWGHEKAIWPWSSREMRPRWLLLVSAPHMSGFHSKSTIKHVITALLATLIYRINTLQYWQMLKVIFIPASSFHEARSGRSLSERTGEEEQLPNSQRKHKSWNICIRV